MSLIKREYYHAVVLEIRGRFLGGVEGPPFLNMIGELARDGRTRVVLDLSRTRFMDSTGIGALMLAQERLRAAGGDVRLTGLESRIRALFLMTHLLGAVFEEYPTREQALSSFYEHARPVAA